MGKQRVLFSRCHFGWCFRLFVTVSATVLFILSLYWEQGRFSTCLLSGSDWLMLGQPMFSSCLIQMLHLHYSITLRPIHVWTLFCKRLFIYSSYVFYLHWLVRCIFLKAMLGCLFVYFPMQKVSVCSFSLIFCNAVRFAVKFVVPLNSFSLNLVMINS